MAGRRGRRRGSFRGAHTHCFLSRDGLPPSELLAAGRREVTAYGGELVDGTVQAVLPGFRVRLTDGRVLRAPRVLVTTGLRDELPKVPGVAQRCDRDVLQCPSCHGYQVRDEALGVLATQPASVHQALLVRQWSRDVVLFEHTYPLCHAEREHLIARQIRIVSGEVTELVVTTTRCAESRPATISPWRPGRPCCRNRSSVAGLSSGSP